MRIVALVSCVALAIGCRADHSRGLKELVGEIHIHGYPGGVHPAALFLAAGVPASVVDGESIVSEPRALAEGACVTLSSTDAPPTVPPPIDAGPLRILGGRGIARVDLRFHDASGYLPEGTLPRTELFNGGEPLTIAAGGPLPFQGVLPAPARLELTGPATLRLSPAGLTVRWRPGDAERIELALVASTRDGRWSLIRCRAADAAGQFAFPPALLVRLPPPPRDLHLEVTRNQIARAATARAGVGVILHASFARTLDGHED